jgi:hypothetical protein
MTGQQAINSGMGKQAAIYNFFIASSLTPGKSVSYEDSMASPLSADVIPSVGSFELISVDNKAGTVTIRWKQGIDPVKGAAVAWKIAAQLGGAAASDKPAVGLPKSLSLNDEATVVIERKSGLLLDLVHRRELRAGSDSMLSTWTLRKRDDD